MENTEGQLGIFGRRWRKSGMLVGNTLTFREGKEYGVQERATKKECEIDKLFFF